MLTLFFLMQLAAFLGLKSRKNVVYSNFRVLWFMINDETFDILMCLLPPDLQLIRLIVFTVVISLASRLWRGQSLKCAQRQLEACSGLRVP
jgi:hypothetical protein